MAVGAAPWCEFQGKFSIHVILPLLGRRVVRTNVLAQLIDGHVKKTGARRICHRVPAFRAGRGGADGCRLAELRLNSPTSFPSSVIPEIQVCTSGTENTPSNSPVARSTTDVIPLLFMWTRA